MAISKQDCLVLLYDLKKDGIDTLEIEKDLIKNDVSIKVLEFINNNRQLDVTSFYEKIRKSYNTKKSKLYKNIMNELDESSVLDIINTLNSYALQASLFSKQVENKNMFFKFVRLDEVYKCLYHYISTGDLIPCIKLLKFIKSDIKVLETTYRK